MKYRKHILAALFCLMLLFYGGDWLLENALRGPLDSRRARTAQLEEGIAARERQLDAARRIGRHVLLLQRQSLPSNTEVARSLYRAWLLELVRFVELSGHSVQSGEPQAREGLYWMLPFTVRGRGTLEQLMQFLFEFYRAGHLHQMGTIGITPLAGGNQFDLSFSIEALVLPGADRADRLTTGYSARLASDDLADYDVIAQRNLFTGGGSLDAVEHTYLVGVVSADGRPQAWFGLRASGEKRELYEGESLQIGRFTGTVTEINLDDRDVIIESDGQRWLLALGENLTEAFALPPEF